MKERKPSRESQPKQSSLFRLWIFCAFIGCLVQSPSAHAQTRADCLACHSDSTLTKDGPNKKPISLYLDESVLNKSTHAKLSCVACHTGFSADEVPHKARITPVVCGQCHSGAAFKHPFHRDIGKAITNGTAPKPRCVECHGTHNVESPKTPGARFSPARLIESCGACHKRESERFPASVHGSALISGVKGAPNCLTCHRAAIARGADSLAVKRAQIKLCLSCHGDDPDVRARTSPRAGFIASYETSVHSVALADGKANAASCVSCHGSHDMKKASDPTSPVNRANIAATCAKCHGAVASAYRESTHGVEAAKGNEHAPGCASCHAPHTILARADGTPRARATTSPGEACLSCHKAVTLSASYVRSDPSRNLSDSYHGLTRSGSSLALVNCASCHGGHDIKPATDPASRVNKANLKLTCGKCHPRAAERFADGLIHSSPKAVVALNGAGGPTTGAPAIADPTRESRFSRAQVASAVLIVLSVGAALAYSLLAVVKKKRRMLGPSV